MPNFGAINSYGINGSPSNDVTIIDTSTFGLGEVNADDVNLITVNGPDYLSPALNFDAAEFHQNVGVQYIRTEQSEDLITFEQVVYFRSVYTSTNEIIFHQNVRHKATTITIAPFRQRVYNA